MKKGKGGRHDGMEKSRWGQGEHANMPKDVEMKAYPKGAGRVDRELDDTITGIDRWSDQMQSKRSKYLSDQH